MRPKLLYISAPATTPINRELYTSFVMSASAMAKTGGKSAQAVLVIASSRLRSDNTTSAIKIADAHKQNTTLFVLLIIDTP
jgi:hypothetical protein